MSGMWIGLAIGGAGLLTSLYGQQKSKEAGKEDAAFLATQQVEAGARSRAIGQRQSAEELRQARLLDSALQARAMGGGGDVTVANLSADIAGEGEYRALSALYEGEEGALGLENQANAGLRSSKARSRAIDYQSAGTLISGSSQLYSKYSGRVKSDPEG